MSSCGTKAKADRVRKCLLFGQTGHIAGITKPTRLTRSGPGASHLLVSLPYAYVCLASSVIFSCMTLSVNGAGGPLLP